MDLLQKFKLLWQPNEIVSDEISGKADQKILDSEPDEALEGAQRVADHLNMIMDYQDRVESIEYLATQARKNFTNLSFQANDEYVYNAVTSLGGQDGVVDFSLIQEVIEILLDSYNQTAAEALTASFRGEI